MKKNILLISIFVSVLFTGCKWGVGKKEANNGLVSLKLTKINTEYSNSEARTIGAVPDWTLGDISNWNVLFIDKDSNAEISKSITQENNSVLVPYGNYKVKVTGVSSTDPSYTLYGETDLQLESPTAELAVIVSVLQTSEGKGSFEYTLKLSNLTLSDGFVLSDEFGTIADSKTLGDYVFTAQLTSTSNTATTVNLKISGNYENGVTTLTIKNAEETEISSGFYYLTVICTYKGQSYAIPLYDSLVEIDDNLTTKGSYDDSNFTGIIVKNIYTSNNPEDEYNGLIATNPKYFNDAINWLADNKDKWTVANIYFVEQEDVDGDTYYVHAGKKAPKYNIQNKIPTSDGDGRKIDVYAGETMIYTLENGKIILNSMADILYFENDASNPAPAPDSLVITFNTDVELLNFVLDNVSLPLAGDNSWAEDSVNPSICVNIDKADADNYSLSKDPLITVTYPKKCNLVNNPVIFDYNDTYNPDDASVMDGYLVLTKSEETDSSFTTKLYVSPSGTAAVNVAEKIPEFSISGANEFYKTDLSSIEYSIVLKEGDSFVSGKTTYTWFLNGIDISTNDATDESVSVDSDTHAITIDFTKNFNVRMDENTLLLVVTCEGAYASVAKKITIKEPPMQLYSASDSYYRSTSPSSSDEALGLKIAVRKDNDTYFGVNYDGKIVYFDGSELDEETYSNYKLNKTDEDHIYKIYSGYYDPDTRYLYLSINTMGNIDKYYLVAVDTTPENVPEEETSAYMSDIISVDSVYKSLFVKNGYIYGTLFNADADSGVSSNKIRRREITINEENKEIELGDAINDYYLSDMINNPVSSKHNIVATDFYYYENYIYFLCKYGMYELDCDEINAFGWIGRISLDYNGIDDTYKLGYSPEATTMGDGNNEISIYTPSSTVNGFYGPERIVAVKKADEIVIQDCGFYCTRYEGGFVYVGVHGGFATVNLSAKTFNYTESDIRFESLGSTGYWEMEE